MPGANDDIISLALFSLLPFMVAFVFIVFVFYRKKRESLIRQQQAELKQQILEVEIKALRAQFNPHFIFNCLNSIYHYMEQNDAKTAGQYLVKFSQVIRLILENSLQQEVLLADDMKALGLYIELEQLRMNHGFVFEIRIDPQVDPDNVLVPPMIIQPFVENSIWYGLNARNKEGHLLIRVSREEDMLVFRIDDNGAVNPEAERQVLPDEGIKKRSLGMSLTRERLDILNKTKHARAGFTIRDHTDAGGHYQGKQVVLKIPYEVSV